MLVLSADALDDLIGDIYEAAAVPEAWPAVLDSIASITSMKGGLLFCVDTAQTVRWTGSKALEAVTTAFIRDGWMERNSRASKLAPMQYAGFVSDLDLFTPEQMSNDPFYRDFLRPHGIGYGAGTIVPVPTGDVIAITVEGDSAPPKEAVPFLDQLRPHLARAGLLSVRLRLERAHTAVDILQRIGLPAAILRSDASVLMANTLFEELRKQRVFDRQGRLRIAHVHANALLTDAVAQLDSRYRGGPWSIPIPPNQGQPPTIVHLIPVEGAAHEIFLGALGLLVVTPLRAGAPPAELLNGLFDLTPAEARVAALIAGGLSPREAAESLGISEETARTALKRVFSKTGVSRQSELAALLPRIALPLSR